MVSRYYGSRTGVSNHKLVVIGHCEGLQRRDCWYLVWKKCALNLLNVVLVCHQQTEDNFGHCIPLREYRIKIIETNKYEC